MRALGAALLLVLLAACAPSSGGMLPSGAGTNAPQDSLGGRLVPDDGVRPSSVKASAGISVLSALVAYRVNNKGYAFYLNGSCTIKHVGEKAVGCVIYFVLNKNELIQKGVIGLYTKHDAKGCLAALSPVYKDIHAQKGKKLTFKTFYWTGKC
jgi:hypothetical protein